MPLSPLLIYVCRMYTLYIVYSAPFCSIVIYGDPQYFMVLHRAPLCSTILHRPSTAPISTGTILRSPCLRSVKYQTAAAAYIRLIMSCCDFLQAITMIAIDCTYIIYTKLYIERSADTHAHTHIYIS